MRDEGTTTTAICYKFYTVFKRRGNFYTICEEVFTTIGVGGVEGDGKVGVEI